MKIQIGQNKIQNGDFKTFVPNPFPPKEGLEFNALILKKSEQATWLLGKLDGITKLLPDTDFFLLMYLHKDDASSSQIEGTMATMIDAIKAQAKINTNMPEDVDDILYYIKALNYGLSRVKQDDFPVSLRLVRELHITLMDKARATHFSDPGEFRKNQNWIGGTRPDNARLVPPPVLEMHEALKDLDKFIYNESTTLTLINAALIHAQFETIHPFLDGIGRTGSMLITFYLWKEGFLEKPVLFLSSYFKKHQTIYFERLFSYSSGSVSNWVDFFLDGVIEIANEAIAIVSKITILCIKEMLKIQKFGTRTAESAALIRPKLYAQPIVNVSLIQERTGYTRAGARRLIEHFITVEILSPKVKDKKYGQSYVYREYLNIFNDN